MSTLAGAALRETRSNSDAMSWQRSKRAHERVWVDRLQDVACEALAMPLVVAVAADRK
jgi:hypothetical protein